MCLSPSQPKQEEVAKKTLDPLAGVEGKQVTVRRQDFGRSGGHQEDNELIQCAHDESTRPTQKVP